MIETLVIQDIEKLRNSSVIDVPLFMGNTTTWNQSEFVVPRDFVSLDWRWNMLARGFYAPQIITLSRVVSLGNVVKSCPVREFHTEQNKIGGLNEILEWLGSPPHNWTEEELDQDRGPVNITIEDPLMTDKVKDLSEAFIQAVR